MKFHLVSSHGASGINRQTPNGDGKWEDGHFQIEGEMDDADWLIVYDEPPPGFETCVPYERRIVFATEPPGVKIYFARYLNQFGTVISPLPRPAGYRGKYIRQQSCLPWFYGIALGQSSPERKNLSWQDLAQPDAVDKVPELSVVCSKKQSLKQHRMRLEFLEELKVALGERLHIFGYGFNEILDKRDAINPYHYHLTLENNTIDHFWTEKTADCFLGGAFMFFSGCGNIGDYFPKEAYEAVDISNSRSAIETIRNTMNANRAHDAAPAIAEARKLVMEKYNLFSVCYTVANALRPTCEASPSGAPTPIRTMSDYPAVNRIARLKRRLYR